MNRLRLFSLLLTIGATACGGDDSVAPPGTGGHGATADASAGAGGGGTGGDAQGGTGGSGGAAGQPGENGGSREDGGASGAAGAGGVAGGAGTSRDAGADEPVSRDGSQDSSKSDAAIIGEDSGAAEAGGLCAQRTGGAMIDFKLGTDTLRVWITNGAFIDQAVAQVKGGPSKVPVFGQLLDGKDCDDRWTWHPGPEKVTFADVTIELCDGRPGDIEGNKTYWFNSVKQYRPWGARVEAVDDRR